MTSAREKVTQALSGDVPLCACNALRKATRAVTQFYDDALKPAGMRATQFSLLATVAGSETTTMSAIAEALVMDRTTLTRNLKPLVKRGLLETVEGEDRRQRRVAITEKGAQALIDAEPLWRQAQAKIAGSLGDERWAGMVRDLDEAVRLALAK